MPLVKTHVSRGFSCNSYLVCDEESGKLCVIDPGTSADEILQLTDGEEIEFILLTHGHFDHVAAAEELREKTGAPIFVHEAEVPLLADPAKNASLYFGLPAVRFSADRTLVDGEELHLGKHLIRILHTPGHSPGGVCYLIGGDLFCGDTLFSAGVGRTDLYGGDEKALFESIRSLKGLPAEIIARPGHGESFLLSQRIAQIGESFFGELD